MIKWIDKYQPESQEKMDKLREEWQKKKGDKKKVDGDKVETDKKQ